MKNKLMVGLLVLVIGISMMISACGSGSVTSGNADKNKGGESNNSNPITLKYAFFAPASTFPAKQMEKWKEEVEKRTNGKVKIELFPGGTLLDSKNMYDGVKNGVAEIGLSSPSYEPGRFPLLAISDLPSGYPNSKVASQVVYDLIQEFPLEGFKDFKVLTAFTTEPAFIQTKEPVSNLNELKGKKLRVAGSQTPVLKEMGASPVGMSQAEVAEALQTGVLEGYVTSREVLMDFKLAEMVKYVTDYELTINTFVAVMNKDVWNSLPPDVQKTIDEVSYEMVSFTGEYHDKHVEESIQWSKEKHGVQIISLTQDEKVTWDVILKPIQDNLVRDLKAKGLPSEEYLKRLNELVKKYKQE